MDLKLTIIELLDYFSKSEITECVSNIEEYEETIGIRVLNDLNKKYNCFTAVRSAGLWIGLELNSKIENLTLQNIMSSAYDEGLMILKANNNTLRLAPALTISEKEIKLGVKKLEKSLSRLL